MGLGQSCEKTTGTKISGELEFDPANPDGLKLVDGEYKGVTIKLPANWSRAESITHTNIMGAEFTEAKVELENTCVTSFTSNTSIDPAILATPNGAGCSIQSLGFKMGGGAAGTPYAGRIISSTSADVAPGGQVEDVLVADTKVCYDEIKVDYKCAGV